MMLKKLLLYISILSLVILASCKEKPTGFDVAIALDPLWTSVETSGRESAITAFTIELIERIGIEERLKVGIYQRSWDNLMLGLQKGDYQAVCSLMQPYPFYQKPYVFSDIYLATGPVLVVASSAAWTSLTEMKECEVGILRGSSNSLILEKYPAIFQRTYDSVPQALDDVSQGVIDALILDILTAQAFVSDLYTGKLKINSAPLTAEGIRLIGLQGNAKKFIQKFNQGLVRLKEKGIYSKLAQKWNIAEPLPKND